MPSNRLAVVILLTLAGCSSAPVSRVSSGGSAHDSMPASPTADAPTAKAAPTAGPTMVVFRSEGPDDGPGYQIAVGDAPVEAMRCDYFGHYAEEGLPRLFPEGPYVTLTLDTSAARQLPRAIPLAGTSLAEAMSCSAVDVCENPTSGTLELRSLTPGTGALGRYVLELPSGHLEGDIDAAWCGP